MDVQLKKKAWLVRYKYYVAGVLVFVAMAGYTVSMSFRPDTKRVPAAMLGLATLEQTDFLEYIESEGVVQPMLAIKVNSRVNGFVDRILAEEGTCVQQGDTILVLSNPELLDEVEEQEKMLNKQLMAYRQQEIEMEQKTLTLRKQVLQNRYELQNLSDNYALNDEEFRMGIKSKAELEMARKEYEYKTQAARLEQESLQHDSSATVVRRSLIEADRQMEIKRFERVKSKRDLLVVRAPITGQLSSLQVVQGQQVGSGSEIGEIKVIDRYKVRVTPSEYYIDRMVGGLPARAVCKGKQYPMVVRRVVPEVKNRTFTADLVFEDEVPPALRIGQTVKTQIELGNSEKVLTVPRGDFNAVTGGQWIFKVVPGERRAVKVNIRLGRQNPLQYEVLEGLEEGDCVITKGYSHYDKAEELLWDE